MLIVMGFLYVSRLSIEQKKMLLEITNSTLTPSHNQHAQYLNR